MHALPGPICFYCADQNPHRDRSLGITGYTLGLLAELNKQGVQLEAIVSPSSFPVPEPIRQIQVPFRTDRALGRLLSDHLHTWLSCQSRASLWHYPKGFLPVMPDLRHIRVGTIADTILQYHADHYPDSRSRWSFRYWLAVLRHSIKNFDLILTVSEASRRAILDFASRYRLPAPPIVVTYEGATLTTARPQEKDSAGYLVHLASRQPHKRTEWLLAHWSEVQARVGDCPPLVVVGDLTRSQKEALSAVRGARSVPFLTRADLEILISRAQAVILPSEVEGFGLPALEAWLLRTPVVFVRGTSVEEICGADMAGGFSLEDPASLVLAVERVLGLNRESIEQHSAEVAEKFSWESCVARTLAAYRQCTMERP